ncbi:MAG: hypothetical protein M0Q87_15165, partial [Ottowia sp.]|nr:hypothetical protein [Ottowia sp.]
DFQPVTNEGLPSRAGGSPLCNRLKILVQKPTGGVSGLTALPTKTPALAGVFALKVRLKL